MSFRVGEPRLVTRSSGGYVVHLGKDERALVLRLLEELRGLLTDAADPPGDHPADQEVTRRLFPVVHPEHPEREEEYQRLMRDELVTSRVAGIDTISSALQGSGRKITLNDEQMTSFLQAVNGVRLVLGTVLDVGDDDELESRPELTEAPEYHLYGYLSWLLDAAVRAMSADLPP